MIPFRTLPRRSPLFGWLHALAALLLACACSRESAPAPGEATGPKALAEPKEVPARVSPETKSEASEWLSEVRRVHVLLDGAKSESEKRAALTEIARAFDASGDISRKLPAGPNVGVESARSEVVSLSQDLASRAARIELEQHRGAEALAWAERGLALSDTPSLLRANLLLDAADAYKLTNQPEKARTKLVEALGINQRLLDLELKTP